MAEHGYTSSQFDHCVYFCKLLVDSFIYLLLYMDDMLISLKSTIKIEKLKSQLKNKFKMKDLEEAKKIIGMKIQRDRRKGTIYLTQTEYLKKIL